MHGGMKHDECAVAPAVEKARVLRATAAAGRWRGRAPMLDGDAARVASSFSKLDGLSLDDEASEPSQRSRAKTKDQAAARSIGRPSKASKPRRERVKFLRLTRDSATSDRGDGGCAGWEGACTPQQDWACVWQGPWNLEGMLAASTSRFAHEGFGGNGKAYNEIMMDTSWYTLHMPHAIEAFFAPVGNEAVAAGRHASFLEHFGLSSEEVPFVTFNSALGSVGPWVRAG